VPSSTGASRRISSRARLPCPDGPVAQRIERQTSNLRAEVRFLPGPLSKALRRRMTRWQPWCSRRLGGNRGPTRARVTENGAVPRNVVTVARRVLMLPTRKNRDRQRRVELALEERYPRTPWWRSRAPGGRLPEAPATARREGGGFARAGPLAWCSTRWTSSWSTSGGCGATELRRRARAGIHQRVTRQHCRAGGDSNEPTGSAPDCHTRGGPVRAAASWRGAAGTPRRTTTEVDAEEVPTVGRNGVRTLALSGADPTLEDVLAEINEKLREQRGGSRYAGPGADPRVLDQLAAGGSVGGDGRTRAVNPPPNPCAAARTRASRPEQQQQRRAGTPRRAARARARRQQRASCVHGGGRHQNRFNRQRSAEDQHHSQKPRAPRGSPSCSPTRTARPPTSCRTSSSSPRASGSRWTRRSSAAPEWASQLASATPQG
jgi:hypothetical protein